MNKELSKRGLDKDGLKGFGKMLLFVGIVMLHIYFNWAELFLSWITPIPCALLFTAATYGLGDLKKPWSAPSDQDGVIRRNGSRYILVFMSIALYLIGIYERG